MWAQIMLEQKKQPIKLYVAFFIFLTFGLSVSVVGRLTSNHVFGYGVANRFQWVDGTESSVQKALIAEVQDSLQGTDTTAKMADVKFKSEAERKILAALKQHDNRAVNATVYQAERQMPQLINDQRFNLNLFTQSVVQDSHAIYYSNRYMVKKKLNFVLDGIGLSAVLNHLMAVLGYEVFWSSPWVVGLPSIIIVIAIIMMVTAFFRDRHEHTDDFIELAPLNLLKQAAVKLGVSMVYLNLLLVGVGTIVLVVMRFFPNHPFGNWAFPYTVNILGEYVTYPLWVILLQYLFLANLWFGLIASIAFCLSNLVHNQLIGMAVAAVVAFAQPLHLLTLLPPAAARFMPGYYTNFVQITLHNNEFTDISLPNITAVFLVWAAAFWLIGSAVMTLRQHKYIPALA